jgi:CxxC-x17-CxxC domain-containing protein
LNKQYTKEEYEKLVPKIIKHMNDMPYTDKKGKVYKYGEFFPSELSPFAYNETIAQEYYPKNKSEILEAGHRWREPDVKQYKVTLQPADLPDHIKDVSDDILNQVIECEHKGECNEQCMGAFKIIPSELQFYRAMNLALPRLCSNCRHYGRLRQRTPFKLWDRQCAKCGKDIKTSYAPDREEIVYCEQCYQQEVA